eukprot:TRINITY_DN72360_c0_g1_i1.p1 TRINITY_DN72360_c0_g1~~TRINITY_DN72360_c0_g1_i1.p1  ORF type:complete len:193 (-),score=50.43 TRINITY_DN72360_c0_g1_i1:56-577(-)
MAVGALATDLREEMTKYGFHSDSIIGKSEYVILMTEPSIVKIMQDVGVDVVVLVDMMDQIFEDAAVKNGGYMTFPDLVEVILSMRGNNAATVKDCKEQIRATKAIISAAVADVTRELTYIKSCVGGGRDGRHRSSSDDDDEESDVEDAAQAEEEGEEDDSPGHGRSSAVQVIG